MDDHCHDDDACGCHGNPTFDGVDRRYRRVLWAVIAINAAMFAVEMVAGHLAGSKALQADALDFLADTLTYGVSLAVIGAAVRVRAGAALAKGASLFLIGAWVVGSTAYEVFFREVPVAATMGVIGFLALAANLASVVLLMRYRDGDANVRSVWLCSRNDAIGNVAVIIAGGAVWLTASAWPDLIVAAVMGALFFSSALQILRRSWREFRSGTVELTTLSLSHDH
ncbi:MAG: cation transporter [Bauldia sp.]|nr:cation transporter [Bauldia sp.]